MYCLGGLKELCHKPYVTALCYFYTQHSRGKENGGILYNQYPQTTPLNLPNGMLEMGLGTMHTAYLSQKNKHHHHQVGLTLSECEYSDIIILQQH